ncbi:MAG: hypothetical protein ACM3W4_09875 [Ignavibacteriales bacterium]
MPIKDVCEDRVIWAELRQPQPQSVQSAKPSLTTLSVGLAGARGHRCLSALKRADHFAWVGHDEQTAAVVDDLEGKIVDTEAIEVRRPPTMNVGKASSEASQGADLAGMVWLESTTTRAASTSPPTGWLAGRNSGHDVRGRNE